MSRFAILKQIILQHRYRLVFTYVLFSLEMVGNLLRPFFLGIAINDLLKGSYRGLILLSVVHLIWLIIGTIRHRMDTRTYSAIYTSLVTKFLARRYHKSDISKLSAHSTLAREFVDFLEFDLVYVMEAVFSIVGSLVLLFFYDTAVVMVCLSILLPVVGFSYLYGKRMNLLNKQKNDELEKQVDTISTGNNIIIREHYDNLRKWQVRISDQVDVAAALGLHGVHVVGTSRGGLIAMVLAAALPSASNVSLLAERFGADNGRIARIIMSSTVAAFITFPLLVWLVGARA